MNLLLKTCPTNMPAHVQDSCSNLYRSYKVIIEDCLVCHDGTIGKHRFPSLSQRSNQLEAGSRNSRNLPCLEEVRILQNPSRSHKSFCRGRVQLLGRAMRDMASLAAGYGSTLSVAVLQRPIARLHSPAFLGGQRSGGRAGSVASAKNSPTLTSLLLLA